MGAKRQSVSPPAPSATSPEQQQRAEAQTAWQAALSAGVGSPGKVALLDQGSFVVPSGSVFVPKAEATRLMRALGNTVNETFVGLVVSPTDDWAADIRFIHEGYVKDDDAKNWSADELLTSLKEGTDAANEDRRPPGLFRTGDPRLVREARLRRDDTSPDLGCVRKG